MSKIQAVILAGGKGSRLRPYTTVLPKALMPVGDFPIAEIIIRQLRHYGIRNIAISTGHLAGLIEAYFQSGSAFGVKIRYIYENEPLGTAGTIKMIDRLDNNFLMINGDTLTDIDFKRLLKFHKGKKGMATIAVKERIVKTDFGVIKFNRQGEFADYIEKPEHTSFVSMGINVLNKECREYIRKNESIGIPELMLRVAQAGERIYCYQSRDLWYDLGRLDDLGEAQEIFEKHKGKFLFKK